MGAASLSLRLTESQHQGRGDETAEQRLRLRVVVRVSEPLGGPSVVL